MDVVWTVLGSLFMLAGIIGCVVPFIPGPPLGYIGFIALQLKDTPAFSTRFLLLWAGVVAVVSLLDYVVPAYGTKKFGGSKYGMWGCIIGLFFGIWLGPWGIILGPFLGAFIGEMLANQNSQQAMKAAMGSFIGFLVGTLLKLITCLVMCWYFVQAL
jgi:uncharacterized protein YqgC (DUF456 family)